MAGLPSEALAMVETHDGVIDLVLTDVVMPEMNGLDLAERLIIKVPDIKILFMSGYAADVISQRSGSGKDMNFIQKPFSASDLAFKIRNMIGTKNRNKQ